MFGADGSVLGRGHNRRVQDGDPSVHGETAAFRNAGRQRSYRGTTMVTTLSPCWYCSGLVRQFGISRVVIGEARTFYGGHDWLAENGVEVVLLDDQHCVDLMESFAVGADQVTGDPEVDGYWFPPNVYPDEVPALQAAVVDYLARMRALADELLRICAAGLGLDDDFFTRHTGHATHTMNLNWYPP